MLTLVIASLDGRNADIEGIPGSVVNALLPNHVERVMSKIDSKGRSMRLITSIGPSKD